MTEIERKALELVNEVRARQEWREEFMAFLDRRDAPENEALCRAIEQHERFRQNLSDAVTEIISIIENGEAGVAAQELERFIITKPDPLVEAMRYITAFDDAKAAEQLRAELAKRGLEIREKAE